MEPGLDLIRTIRQEAIRYLAGEATVSEFAKRFADESQACIDSTPPMAEPIVAEVRLVLAEFGRGDRSEDELRDELRSILTFAISVEWESPKSLATATHTGSSSSVVVNGPSLDTSLIKL
jgi:hypothetical protein